MFDKNEIEEKLSSTEYDIFITSERISSQKNYLAVLEKYGGDITEAKKLLAVTIETLYVMQVYKEYLLYKLNIFYANEKNKYFFH